MAFYLNFKANFGSKMARKWRELAPIFLRASATAPFYFTFPPPRRALPFSVRASGAVALKVAQVPSTANVHINLHTVKKLDL